MARETPQSDALQSVHLLRSLTSHERDLLARECTFVRIAKGAVVLSQGTVDARGVAFVISGRLSIRGLSACGKEITYAVVGPGGNAGDFAAMDSNASRSASVEADAESIIAFMPSSTFRRVVAQNPLIARAVIDNLVCMVRQLSERVIEFATTSAQERVSREVLRLAGTVSGSDAAQSVEIAGMPDQSEIARRTGLTRESVCRTFKRMQQDGVVRRVRGDTLMVCDMAALRGLAVAEAA